MAGALVEALIAQAITTPSPIQAATIPDALARRDVAGEAPTGSGKTLAFGLPLLQLVDAARRAGPAGAPARIPIGLVVAPTRELARQIIRTLDPLATALGLRLHAVHGGVPNESQIEALRQGVDVVIACPGRLLDLVEQGAADLSSVKTVVIDEADRLADMGFLPHVMRLLQLTSSGRQTLLFSATLAGPVEELVATQQRSPVRHHVAAPDIVPVRHHLWVVANAGRVALLADIVRHCGPTVAFTNTRGEAQRVAAQVRRLGVEASLLHGGNAQHDRTRALDRFAAGATRLMVATDVAARGLHVEGVACVVHHDLPTDPTDYVHRSGRTGRAGAVGTVVAFVDPAAIDRARRLVARVAAELPGDIISDAEITEPDVLSLESAADRVAIDRELIAMGTMSRPGAVGTVKFNGRG